MKILITKDTMSEIYLDAVRIRQKVFVQEQGVPANLEKSMEMKPILFISYFIPTIRSLQQLCDYYL